MSPEFIPFGPDPDEPGLPVAGYRHSGYPRADLQVGMPVRLKHHPLPQYPHAIQFVDELDRSLGYVPDNVARVLAEALTHGQISAELHLAKVQDNGLTEIEIWVEGVLRVS